MSAVSSFHLSEAWFDAWRQAYLPAGAEPRRVGGLPMLAERARLGPIRYRRLRAQTNVHSLRIDLPDAVANLPALLLADGEDLVSIDYVPEDSPLLAAARAWPHAIVAPHALSPVADCRASYDHWFAARSRRSRHRWRTLDKEVFDRRGMCFEMRDGSAGLPALLDEILALERSGWKGREGTAILDSPADTRFYTTLAHHAAAAGALRIAVLLDGARIVAFEFGILGGDRQFMCKVGYDETLEALSIGHVLAVRNIRHCCEDPAIAWYDKLGNGMTPAPYKLRFCDHLDTLYSITLYAPTWRGALLRAEAEARSRAKDLRDRWRARAAA